MLFIAGFILASLLWFIAIVVLLVIIGASRLNGAEDDARTQNRS